MTENDSELIAVWISDRMYHGITKSTALLLEQGRVEEAVEVYRADLGYDTTLSRACQHPDNVWSLHGYHECLERLGRREEAAIVKQRLRTALARADVPITASCFCRLHAQSG